MGGCVGAMLGRCRTHRGDKDEHDDGEDVLDDQLPDRDVADGGVEHAVVGEDGDQHDSARGRYLTGKCYVAADVPRKAAVHTGVPDVGS